MSWSPYTHIEWYDHNKFCIYCLTSLHNGCLIAYENIMGFTQTSTNIEHIQNSGIMQVKPKNSLYCTSTPNWLLGPLSLLGINNYQTLLFSFTILWSGRLN
jgi:hypothetical protein